MSAIRILIVEDEPLIAEDISVTLQNADFIVCGIAYSFEDALQQLHSNQPDMVLLDINLNGGTEGIDIAERINAQYSLPFIYLTSYSDRQTLERAKKTEPSGYIVKPFSEASLYTTIEVALHNYAQKLKAHFPEINLTRLNQLLPASLSEKEFEVLQLIYNGKTNQQIAEQLFISVNTVKKRISNSYLKIDAETRSGAIAKLRELMVRQVM
jgi:RNA polymerase sigma factor (sigma-70 family)